MQYIKCKFLKGDKPSGRAYTYKCEEDARPGDIVLDSKGSKLLVVDEPVDVEWIRTFGINKLASVTKEPEPATVREWSLIYSGSEYTAPELRKPQLAGKVYGSPKFKDGTNIVTSDIKKIEQAQDHKVIVTRSGSRYRIYPGDIDSGYESSFPGSYDKIKVGDVE